MKTTNNSFYQAFKAGGRYYFEIELLTGTLMKIGVCRKDVYTELVSSTTAFLLNLISSAIY